VLLGDAVAFWAYMRCADGRFYAGHTDTLEQRIAQHQAGKGSDFTARRLPVMLVWSETFPTREEALAAERQIKGWSRAKKEALIVGDRSRISELTRSREARPSTSLRTNGGNAATSASDGPAIHTPFVLSEVEARAPGEASATSTPQP
jgi:predicted GIY-YIG superfamily endonuclease